MSLPTVPNEAQMKAFMERGPTGPFVMVNLLKYRERSQYPEGSGHAPCPGREAYGRYGAVALEHVGKAGGRIVWGGARRLTIIGGAQDDWDDVVCVFYPGRDAFLNMIANPDYLVATIHRTAALERTALLCCDPGSAA